MKETFFTTRPFLVTTFFFVPIHFNEIQFSHISHLRLVTYMLSSQLSSTEFVTQKKTGRVMMRKFDELEKKVISK